METFANSTDLSILDSHFNPFVIVDEVPASVEDEGIVVHFQRLGMMRAVTPHQAHTAFINQRPSESHDFIRHLQIE